MSVKPTNIPKCHLRQSADSAGNISRHCKLGEVTENIRTFALPFESKPYTFRMKYKYDSFNRMQRMTYPDGEKVSYGYNRGGMLYSIEGDKGGQAYMYVEHIAYNKYELKESVLYGNGSFTTYDYDNLMRLAHLQSFTGAAAEQMQDITYDYDAVSNITHIDNQAPALSYGIGGTYSNDYAYDNLYRISSANGIWDNGAMINTFDLGMSYHQNGRIAVKQLRADILDHLGNITTTDYNKDYHYYDGRNTLQQTVDQDGSPQQTFEWDNAGNMTVHRLHDECIRRMCWDEENRLAGVADCNYASLYQYDANGERTYKLTGQYSYQNINGHYYPYAVLDNPTLYASPYVVCTPKDYTKHYYAESERVASKIGNGCLKDLCRSLNTDADFNKEDEPENPYLKDCDEENELLFEKQERNCIYSKNVMACLESENFIAEKTLEGLYSRIECVEEGEDECYWYHPDHLGSSSWITFTDGKAVQHLHYLPWGEDFVDQRSTSWNAIFAFSAKERDVETGLSYFGARYYSSELSIWLSVDPMSDKYPSTSPFAYCRDNPVILYDPNGMFDDWVENKNGHIYWDENATSQETTKKGETYLGKEGQRAIGNAVWNYNCDGTIDKQKPIMISEHNACVFDFPKAKENKSNIDIWNNTNLLTATVLAFINETTDNKEIKKGTFAFGAGLTCLSIRNTWKSDKIMAEKIFDTSTDIIGLCGVYGYAASTELQFYKNSFKFFVKCKQELDLYFKEINNPNYWWNW